ncbi:S-methyl-5-thioribose-1-phosphate isomerase [Sediminicurvatus halobius]|uniref:Methylthioribose-1-phosphate isomerase n=1 Tax=Sediminicurvatus halobius TaxID=2182432 RepID=A0A2U2N370_9GAMM|nr:S-methyl-5-thioribose-1-phosphate isomerase [Spiribacter halobius]PWG63478.1 S-methyl-5-thioribose-1-phosphate isomerase [Spiribacter halobius]UEX79652.1 S-methyl-5-thioribose-1-phosphate isomerase [Spiribacter halobius]
MTAFDRIRAVFWESGRLHLLDQRRLPTVEHYLDCTRWREVAEAIRDMVVRGAPAIGIAAAYGVALAARERSERELAAAFEGLAATRPTAVNLGWALARMRRAHDAGADAGALLAEAQRIQAEDVAANRRIGALGAEHLPAGRAVLTHCNTGSLATGGYGTALGVVRSAYAAGRLTRVYAGETRPWLQGARLTAWELQADGIPVRLIADGAAASLLASGEVGAVVVGADRVAANGDVANKIGTYALALAAAAHDVPFLVAAPLSTLDADTASGAGIPIETRGAEELLSIAGQAIAPPDIEVWNPVFDVTPARLVDALITERGVVARPDAHAIRRLLSAPAHEEIP